MEPTQRKIAVITSLGRRYSGLIDIPNATFRTTDLLNSLHIYWRDPNIKCYDDALLMTDVRLFIDNKTCYRKFDTIQIKIAAIICFYDDIEQVGDDNEKKRATALQNKMAEPTQTIHIITKQESNSFYDIMGVFFGQFRKKAKDNFIPLTQTRIIEVKKNAGKWFQKKIILPHEFICINSNFIESVTLP